MKPIEINDVGLCHSLITCGCKPIESLKLHTATGTTLTFYFEPTDEVLELIDIWNNPQDNPDHVMAGFRINNINRIGVFKEIKEMVGYAIIDKNGKSVLISTNASDETKAKLLSLL